MLKKVALIGITTAAIVGTGGAALAATSTGSAGPSASPAPSASAPTAGPNAKPAAGPGAKPAAKPGAKKNRHELGLRDLRGVDHATWVTGAAGHIVTHQASRGKVSAVTPTSITVTSADATTDTFTVGSSTKVHTRANRKNAVIADVKVGDPVLVTGTGATNPVAQQVLDTKK